MGIQTPLTLAEAQALFPTFEIESLLPTEDGVMDTTYLTQKYVLKHYERDIEERIRSDRELLTLLSEKKFNTPRYLSSSKGWHLYSRLKGSLPQTTHYFHIQALARFLRELHSIRFKSEQRFLEPQRLQKILNYTKEHHFYYYKKLHSLTHFSLKNEGFIHGDIFKDNTLFCGEKIAVFDFIDGGMGSFSFDIAVALLSFNPSKRQSYLKLFLQTYNQKMRRKLQKHDIEKEIQNAAKLYALLRIEKYKNIKKAKELANLW